MASEDISPSDFASLDDYDKYLTKRLEELEKDKITLENRIKGRQVIEKLPSSAQEAEKKFIEVIERPGFKEVFCSRKVISKKEFPAYFLASVWRTSQIGEKRTMKICSRKDFAN